ncbi:sensor domain-containing diguanylate cyclase [Alcaligenaceae bacterium CGII-47]|nr:sensor domain-containing diguanylate cyclase [Alcaligenaceae bacterium CGII-47]
MLKINKAPLKNRLISLTIACLVAGLMWQGFQAIQKEQIIAATNVAKFQALDKLVEIAGALESEINETIKYSDFLSLILSHNPDISQHELDGYAELTLQQNDSIVGVQFAPDGIVTMVYPYENHRMALGHDLLKDPDRRQYAIKAIETRKAVLQGPVQALQGGYFLFNRKAVFLPGPDGEKFWGLSVVAVDFDRLMDRYKQLLNDSDYLFSLTVHGTNGTPVQIWGDGQILNDSAPHQTIQLPHARWELAILPKNGWVAPDHRLFRNEIFYGLTTLLMFLLAAASSASYLEKRQKSRTDPLTGSLNKNAIQTQGELLIRRKEPFIILIMDLNNFKAINDTYGHYVGDLVLIEVANRIQKALRRDDALSRFGGDEYIAVVTDGHIDTDVLIRRIIENVTRPLQIEEHTLTVGISVGWATYTGGADTYESLYQAADKRMYEMKHSTKPNRAEAVANTNQQGRH